jgi:ElaA protein
MQPHVATFDELDTRTLLGILQLRCEVFVAEQECAYADVDGRDAEPGTRHLWFDEAGTPIAYLRILREPDGSARIGRVCTAKAARGRRLSSALMATALELIGPATTSELNAQSYLVGFYEGFGFVPSGPEFLDDGIPHTPMRRSDGSR